MVSQNYAAYACPMRYSIRYMRTLACEDMQYSRMHVYIILHAHMGPFV